MNIGDMIFYVDVEEPFQVQTPAGGFVDGWKLWRQEYAAITPIGSSETTQSAQQQSIATSKITMWWFDGLTGKHRIKHRGIYYNIVGPPRADASTGRMTWEVDVKVDENAIAAG